MTEAAELGDLYGRGVTLTPPKAASSVRWQPQAKALTWSSTGAPVSRLASVDMT